MATSPSSAETATVTEKNILREGVTAYSKPAEKPPSNNKEEDSEKNLKEVQQVIREERYVAGFKLVCIIVPTTLAYFLVMLDGSIISTAIPQITSTFPDSLLDVGWYGSAYQLASSAIQPLSGKVYMYFNTKASCWQSMHACSMS